MKKFLSIFMIILFTVFGQVSFSTAELTSTFDSSDEGWSILYDAIGSWQSSGGNPDGYYRGRDLQTGETYYFVSPGSWSGDWSQYIGQNLTFDMRMIDTGGRSPVSPRKTVFIEGSNGNTLEWMSTYPLSAWTKYSVDLSHSAFGVEESYFNDIIRDVRELRIRGEWTTGDDIEGLDNVRIGGSEEPLDPGLVCHYQFFNNADDSYIHQINATEYNGVDYGIGIKNKSAKFDGIDDYIDIPYQPFLYLPKFSISVWINTITQKDAEILTNDPDRSDCKHGYHLRVMADGSVRFSVDPSSECGSANYIFSDAIVNDGKWHHIVAVYNTTLNLYVDSVLQSDTETGSYAAVMKSIRVGMSRSSDPSERNFFEGNIDELRIYNCPLSAYEVLSLYYNDKKRILMPMLQLLLFESDQTASLISGQAISDSVSEGEWKFYKIRTASSDTQISFDMTHLSDDIDLYVRKGSKPTLNDWDCRPFKEKDGDYVESETCIMDNSEISEWYVGIYGNMAGEYKLKALIGEVEGWASTTGFKEADTEIRENIVELANNAIGDPSGQSVVCSGECCWLTDTANNDGARMRDAIIIYRDWREDNPEEPLPEDIRNSMLAAFSDSDYLSAQKEALVDQIVNVHDGTVPTTDNETLQYMNVQRQCLEWAMFIANQAGGKRVNYGCSRQHSAINDNVRPGMGLYNIDIHAMIIIDVYYDAQGDPINVRVAEANNGPDDLGWQNPPGQTPWERAVRGDRDDVGLIYTAINYDK